VYSWGKNIASVYDCRDNVYSSNNNNNNNNNNNKNNNAIKNVDENTSNLNKIQILTNNNINNNTNTSSKNNNNVVINSNNSFAESLQDKKHDRNWNFLKTKIDWEAVADIASFYFYFILFFFYIYTVAFLIIINLIKIKLIKFALIYIV
jgi:hypothetical protein